MKRESKPGVWDKGSFPTCHFQITAVGSGVARGDTGQGLQFGEAGTAAEEAVVSSLRHWRWAQIIPPLTLSCHMWLCYCQWCSFIWFNPADTVLLQILGPTDFDLEICPEFQAVAQHSLRSWPYLDPPALWDSPLGGRTSTAREPNFVFCGRSGRIQRPLLPRMLWSHSELDLRCEKQGNILSGTKFHSVLSYVHQAQVSRCIFIICEVWPFSTKW